MDEGLISCTGVLGVFVIVFGFIALMRYLRFRETLALAEKGLVKVERAGGNGKDTLRWGIALTAVGLALCVGLYPLGFWIDPGGTLPLRFGPWMLVGLLPMFFGLGLALIYVLTRDEQPPGGEKKAEGEPAPPAQE
jgi:hypothetical protein